MQNCDVQFMPKACFEKLYPGKTLVFSSAVPAQEENIFALFTVLYTSSNRGDFFLSQNDAFSFAQYLMRLDKSFYYFLCILFFLILTVFFCFGKFPRGKSGLAQVAVQHRSAAKQAIRQRSIAGILRTACQEL